jgi:hypothetical protein
VITIFKTVDKPNMPKFRTIYFLKSFSKIFEKIIYARIYTYVVLHKLLANEQYRFRSSLSTGNASYTLIHEVLSAMNNKHTVGGIFCDLSKPFDCVNHRILLAKLVHCGIRCTFGGLIKSYLTLRYQRVALKDKTNAFNCFNWELLKLGIPQGSILGPLFFLIIHKRFAFSNS